MSFRIIMVETTHPGNIGATARVMANMGLSELYLVSPRSFPDSAATARAAGADNILTQAQTLESLEEAVADCGCVIGATARRRSLAWPLLDSEQAASRLVTESERTTCALVFGPEACGLSNAHLDLCHAHLRIDVNEAFPSLNVATAIAIMAYELRKQSDNRTPPAPTNGAEEMTLMTMGEFDQLIKHLQRVLARTAFLAGPRIRLIRKLRRLLLQGVQSTQEVNILRGVLTSLEYALGASPKGEQENKNTPT